MTYSHPFPPDAILHLAVPSEWRSATQDGVYSRSWRRASLAEVGFIHCSFPHQVEGTATTLYADLAEVVLLHIDPEQCEGPVVIEAGTGEATEKFPHLYAPLPLRAVRRASSWPRRPDGTYVLTDAGTDVYPIGPQRT